MADNRDRSYRDRISEKIDPSKIGISRQIHRKRNRDKSWKYKEYPEFHINFICISKDGTLGEIFKVGDLYIGLPSSEYEGYEEILNLKLEKVKIPLKKEIINKDISIKNAKWKRESPPKDFKKLWNWYKSEMAVEKNGIKRSDIRQKFKKERNQVVADNKDFVDSEFRKREHGIFIKIDEEVHYLTGENWMFLQHYYLTESNMYPNYRVTAMESYWHWEACRADSRCWGEIRGKARRTSWTVESASIALNCLTITKYAQIPVVSERTQLASKLFTGKIANSFKYYPIYFKPLIDLPNDEPQSKLSITHETDDSETSIIDIYPTKDTAYDSTKVKDVSINDEIGKWVDASLTEFISRHSKCHTEGGATGRFGSTAGDYEKGGGKEFSDEFRDANANERNSLGRTINGLISFFIDVCYTMTEPFKYFDEWGYSIVNDPKEPILNEEGKVTEIGAITHWQVTFNDLKGKEQKKKLNGFLRDSPRQVKHMFRSEGGKNNDFDIANLNNNADFLDERTPQELSEKIYVGNLRYVGEKYKSKVEWVNDINGKFKTTWIPDPELQNNYSLKEFHGKSVNMPNNSYIGAFGVDSYDIIGQASDGKGSDGAIVGHTKFNLSGSPTNSLFLRYRERPKKRDDFFDDVIMVCQFFGFYALIESNKSRVLEYMYEKGFTGYALRRQDKKWKNLSDSEKLWGGIPSSTETVKDQVSGIQDYVSDFVGINLENDCKVWHKDIIEELIDFIPSQRKKFDLAVASGLAIMGSQYKDKKRNEDPDSETYTGLSFSDFSA